MELGEAIKLMYSAFGFNCPYVPERFERKGYGSAEEFDKRQKVKCALFLYEGGKTEAARRILESEDFTDDADAMRMLGEIYFAGKIVERDLKRAREYLECSVNKGNGQAKLVLGLLLIENEESPKDFARGYELVCNAALNRNDRAAYAMAWFAHDNRGKYQSALDGKIAKYPTQDRTQEYFWFHLAIREIDAGRILYHAQNLMEDSYDKCAAKEEIIEALTISAARGNQQAMHYLACEFYNKFQKSRNRKDIISALHWFYQITKPTPVQASQMKKAEEELNKAMCETKGEQI